MMSFMRETFGEPNKNMLNLNKIESFLKDRNIQLSVEDLIELSAIIESTRDLAGLAPTEIVTQEEIHEVLKIIDSLNQG